MPSPAARNRESARSVEFSGDGLGNAFQFARLIEGVDKIAEGIKSHTPAKLTENPAPGNRGENQ